MKYKKLLGILFLVFMFISVIKVSFADEAINVDTNLNFFEKLFNFKEKQLIIVTVGNQRNFNPGEKVRMAYSDTMKEDCIRPTFYANVIRPDGSSRTGTDQTLGYSVKKGELVSAYIYYTVDVVPQYGQYDVLGRVECAVSSTGAVVANHGISETVSRISFYVERIDVGIPCIAETLSTSCITTTQLQTSKRICPSGDIIVVKEDCNDRCVVNDCIACSLKSWEQWSNSAEQCGVRYKYDTCNILRDKEEKTCGIVIPPITPPVILPVIPPGDGAIGQITLFPIILAVVGLVAGYYSNPYFYLVALISIIWFILKYRMVI